MRMITDSRWSGVPIEAARLNSTSCLLIEDDAPGYTELLTEREDLLKRIHGLEKSLCEANQRAAEVWGVVEDVVTGARLTCSSCGCYLPCSCEHK